MKLFWRMYIRDLGVNEGRNGSSVLLPLLASQLLGLGERLKYENADMMFQTGVEWMVFVAVSHMGMT